VSKGITTWKAKTGDFSKENAQPGIAENDVWLLTNILDSARLSLTTAAKAIPGK
jgi:hypothetical protein